MIEGSDLFTALIDGNVQMACDEIREYYIPRLPEVEIGMMFLK